MTIIAHNFDGIQINQTSEDTMIAGHLIPKGWVNATAMCKVNGKTWSNYWKLKSSKSFASSVSTALLIGRPATISIEGGNDKNLQGTWVHFASSVSTALLIGRPATISIEGGNDKNLQGTWVHFKVAIHLAIWLSDDFALWATDALMRIINGEFKALTSEALEAQEKLQKLWDDIRSKGIGTRRELTDAIKDYLLRHPNVSDNYKKMGLCESY
ncbi:KilA-N domain-containing protein [Nodularia phage vB_NspS-kac68v162]|uniref:KilA-N domain-containing protein n=1 Tax=Nodularia phage vB_NspS-kac68v162 TaxID=2557583 RepID=A0A482MJX9_9CAUD|nr:KilA-N domain-containing protein [Nodularia phage vB_NspS-kac68v162]